MAYADQEMSGNKITAIIIVALIHIVVGYGLITGLAYEAVQNVVERVTTVDIDEPPPPEEEPPPPPEEVPETVPPPFVPPPQVNVRSDPPQQRSPENPPDNNQNNRQPEQYKQCSDGSRVLASQSCGPATKTCPDGKTYPANATCPAPPPRVPPKSAAARNNPGSWVTNSDYRQAWVRREYAGTVSFSLSIDANGKVAGCSVTGGSAPQELKDATCRLVERRARFNAATDGEGRPTSGSYSNTVRWQIPE
ncbi:MAG: energy transducer TonB [Altererythrobacter sp.]